MGSHGIYIYIIYGPYILHMIHVLLNPSIGPMLPKQANFLLSPNLFEVAKSKGWQLGRKSKGMEGETCSTLGGETSHIFMFAPIVGEMI